MQRRLGWIAIAGLAAACQRSGDPPPAPAPAPKPPVVAPAEPDLAGLAAGALVRSGPPDAWKLFDEDRATLYEQRGDDAIVVQLPDRISVRAIAVDAPPTLTPNRVRVEGSEDGVAWAPLAEAALAHGGELAVPPSAAPARVLRVHVVGSLQELRVLGTRLTTDAAPDATGAWAVPGVGTLQLTQRGSVVTGCGGGEAFTGAFDGRVLRFALGGHAAVMTFGGAGRAWFGAWADAKAPLVAANADVAPTLSPLAPCAPPPGIAGELAASGRARLYGVVFDHESDALRDDAKPTLDELLAVMTAQPALAIRIEAFTDGTAASNQILSAKQAIAVRTYLVTAGIDAKRIEMKALGAASPLAPNSSPLGRAQNRRIEVVRS